MKLFICGNGLDLHIGYRTSYRDYKSYLESMRFPDGKSAVSIVNNSYFFIRKDADCWSDLEKSLRFDFESYLKEMIFAFDRKVNPNKQEETNSQLSAARKFFENDPKSIARDFTNEWFMKWIMQEYYGRKEDVHTKDESLLMADADLYINFNYTPTLEDFYGIPASHILYIHNRIPENKDRNLEEEIIFMATKHFQFGSTENSLEECEELLKKTVLKAGGNLIREKDLEKSIKDIYINFSKDLKKNYSILLNFIEDKSISEVNIMGHSIMGVDEPYYSDILIPALKDCKWIFYVHDKTDEKEKKNFIKKYGLNYHELRCW